MYLVDSAESLSSAGLRFEVSSFDPPPYYIFRESGSAVEAIATRKDDISCCGEPDFLLKPRRFFGETIWETGGPGKVICLRGR